MAEQVDWFGPILRYKLAKEREDRYKRSKKTQQKCKKHKNKRKNKKRKNKIKGICPCFVNGKCPHCMKCQEHKPAFIEWQKPKKQTLGELCVELNFSP